MTPVNPEGRDGAGRVFLFWLFGPTLLAIAVARLGSVPWSTAFGAVNTVLLGALVGLAWIGSSRR